MVVSQAGPRHREGETGPVSWPASCSHGNPNSRFSSELALFLMAGLVKAPSTWGQPALWIQRQEQETCTSFQLPAKDVKILSAVGALKTGRGKASRGEIERDGNVETEEHLCSSAGLCEPQKCPRIMLCQGERGRGEGETVV